MKCTSVSAYASGRRESGRGKAGNTFLYSTFLVFYGVPF